MAKLHQLVPDSTVLLEMEPEQLGELLLQVFSTEDFGRNMFCVANFRSELYSTHEPAYPRDTQETVLRAITEAFAWLESQVLIVPADSTNGANGWRILSRRGERLAAPKDWQAYRKASLLPKELLHQEIHKEVYTSFVQGDYETAIFKAFKSVEIAVRNAINGSPNELGVKLMRKAFSPESGPLTLKSQDVLNSEKEATQHLFAAAIGLLKNPSSHRTVSFDDVAEVVESLMFASLLRRIVDSRVASSEENFGVK